MPWQPGMARPLAADALSQWQKRVEAGERVAKQFHPQWERGLESYAKAKVPEMRTEVNALLPYRHVEAKKSQLFHRTPEVTLLPVDPQDQAIPYNALLPLRQKFLNHELGPKGANAKRALHKTLIDTLAASGFMICKLGFEQASLPLQTTRPGMLGQPAETVTLQVPIWSRRFISSISSKKFIWPADFHDTDFDAAPWLAYRDVMPVSQARRLKWKIPPDFAGTARANELVYKHGDAEDGSDELLEFTEIWYRASLFDPSVFNPELYRRLVLVKGINEPVEHVDSPYRTIDERGQLTDDSMVGNPIHVGTLRDLTDSATVPSDLVVGEQLAREEDKFRTDLVINRNARKPITLISDAIDDTTAEKIIRDRAAKVPSEFISEGGSQRIVAVVQAGSEPRDNFTAQDYIERDFEQALGVSANQSGQFSKSKRTATEIRTVQGNSSARAETEKDRIRDYFVALVRKFDTIVQRTATVQELQKVLGQQGAALWEQWRALPGKYIYDILPDSGQYVDLREYQQQALQLYELARRDDRVNTEDVLTMLARAFQRDPAKFIAPAQDKTIEPPSASIAFKGEDTLNAAMGNLLLDMLANGGVKLRPETIAAFAMQHAMPPQPMDAPIGMDGAPDGHGGPATRVERINKHQEQKTGGMNGVAA